MSQVPKFDLRLLTRNGQSIDGNWTVFWRKLDGLLAETGLLLTEPDWSIYGNWTIYLRKQDVVRNWTICWRKLYCLLTETGRSIDGKSAVYLWKECIRFSSFWWPENEIFAKFWNPRFRGHLAYFISFSVVWWEENAIFAG